MSVSQHDKYDMHEEIEHYKRSKKVNKAPDLTKSDFCIYFALLHITAFYKI